MRPDAPTPRLYPLTIELACGECPYRERLTVASLAAQRQWTDFYQERHEHPLSTLVPV